MSTASRRSSATSSSSSASADDVASLRAALRPNFPEIDDLHSDAYIQSVLSVPGRAFEYARDRKIRGALEWRRTFGVEALRGAFRYEKGILLPNRNSDADEVTNSDSASEKEEMLARFQPSAELIELCLSGAFGVRPGDYDSSDRRIVLHARTSLIDWWKSGVDAGLQYHVLVIEHALSLIRRSGGALSESMTLLVDTEGIGMIPPPIGALRGLVGLLQQAYPDRIHQIVVFPVNGVLRRLYDLVSPMMAQRSRDKILLLGSAEEALVKDGVEKKEG